MLLLGVAVECYWFAPAATAVVTATTYVEESASSSY